MSIEKPELEKQRNDLINRINKDKEQLIQLEDRILKLLFDSEGNILDDEALVDGLNETKELLITTNGRLLESKESEDGLTTVREKYRLLTVRTATLFFSIQLLSKVKRIYQFSLDYFINIVRDVVSSNDQNIEHSDRIIYLNEQIVNVLYENVACALFENDKIVLQFLMAFSIEQGMGAITDKDLQHILISNVVENEGDCLSDYSLYLAENYDDLCGLNEDILKICKLTIGDNIFTLKSDENCEETIKNWNNSLDNLQKMSILKILRPDLFSLAVNAYSSFNLHNTFSALTKKEVLLRW